MPDFGTWLGWHEAGDFEEWYRELDRSDSIGFMIGHRGVSITLVRNGVKQTAQSALLVPAGRNTDASEVKAESGVSAIEQLLLVGQSDFNVERGDKFKYPSTMTRLNYEVVRVEKTLVGMVQAYAEEIQ